MAVGPGGRLLATGGLEAEGGGGYPVRVWDVLAGKLRFPPLRHAEAVRALQFSTDGRLLLTGLHHAAEFRFTRSTALRFLSPR